MDISPYTFNSHALNSGNYQTVISESSPIFAQTAMSDIQRADTWPVRGGKQFKSITYVLDITVVSGTIADGIDEIGKWFNEEEGVQYNFVVRDANNSNKEWYVLAEPLGLITFRGNVITVALYVAEPIWKSVTVNSSTWNITASGQTKDLAVGGNRIARPKFVVGPTSARTGGFGYKRFVGIANRVPRVYKDAINLADSNWNTAALVTAGKMQADGDDVRVYNDTAGNVEEYRWFGGGGINTTTTRIFSNVNNLPPTINMTTGASISSSGAVTTVTIANTKANVAALKELATMNYKFFAIDMGTSDVEIFNFTAVNITALQITGTTRAQKGTTNKAHASGATLRHIYGYYVMYGNSGMTAPTTDDAFKPMFDLTNSTNASHVYASFYDALNPSRIGMWSPQVLSNVGLLSETYTDTEDAQADVATVIGAAIKVYLYGTTPRAPIASLAWSLSHPAGITTLTWTGKKYRYATSWPSALVQKSNDGKKWSTVATEATPSTAQTWEALSTHSSVTLSGTYLNIRLLLEKTITASASNMAAFEIGDLTAALDTSATPLIYFGTEEVNNYEEFRITNGATGHYIEVSQQIPVNTTITIDTEALEAYTADGSSVTVRLDNDSRAEWLPLNPDATNTLTYTETGANAVTITTTWNDRNL